jgi:phosphoribosyl 1,2-cyclic phosphodiesterase
LRVTLWGTRGSRPTPRPENIRYGGNTCCVEVRACDGSAVVLDAGTGIRGLSAQLAPDIARVDILLTHFHLDHILGLGFFGPLFQTGHDVHIWGPAPSTLELKSLLSRCLSPPLLPVRLRDLPCRLTLHYVPLGGFELPGFSVTAEPVSHPGAAVGYRISDGTATLAYIPDHELALEQRGLRQLESGPEFALAAAVDLLIHDAQYTLEEYRSRRGCGHSALPHALAFAGAANVRHLVPFHHDPGHDDDTLDRLFAREATFHPFAITPGVEGATFDLGPSANGRAA